MRQAQEYLKPSGICQDPKGLQKSSDMGGGADLMSVRCSHRMEVGEEW